MPSSFARDLLDRATAGLAYVLYHGVRALPVDFASALGGAIARGIGPLLPMHKIAKANIAAAFPEKSEAERARIVGGMWDNIGRTFFEYPHQTGLIESGRVEMGDLAPVDTLRDDGKPGLLWSGHLANWELVSGGAGARGLVMHRIYRAPNNRRVDWLFHANRDLVKGELLPKGAVGAKRAMVFMRRGEHLGMMVDQKMNDGIAVPFFGRPAMTASALATFALRFAAPVVGARAIRLKGARFRLDVVGPYTIPNTGDRFADELAAMTEVNRILEGWIREYPEQWLWVHRRWPKAGDVLGAAPTTQS
jgi:Kdo2-lipid IVA lauroyltransferase/acyltransferase